jgi:hypothetical protein
MARRKSDTTVNIAPSVIPEIVKSSQSDSASILAKPEYSHFVEQCKKLHASSINRQVPWDSLDIALRERWVESLATMSRRAFK